MKTVIFDMDGILFDTERLCMDSWCKVAEKHEIPDMEKVFPRCIGSNLTDTKQIVLNHYGEEFDFEGFRREADGWFMDYINQNGMPLMTGVRELLQYLKEKGVTIGLASSTSRKNVERELKMAGIFDYFQSLVTGDMIEHSKPEPEIYLIACESLGVSPADAYAIEDSYNGIRAAHAAGMMPIMVPDLIAPNEEMEKLSTVILKDLLAVIDYFEAGNL